MWLRGRWSLEIPGHAYLECWLLQGCDCRVQNKEFDMLPHQLHCTFLLATILEAYVLFSDRESCTHFEDEIVFTLESGFNLSDQ